MRIQCVLCVNEDDFPTRVAVLAWQLRSDWTKNNTEFVSFDLCDMYSVVSPIHSEAAISKRLVTHHRVCATAGFSLCGTLRGEIMLGVFEPAEPTITIVQSYVVY